MTVRRIICAQRLSPLLRLAQTNKCENMATISTCLFGVTLFEAQKTNKASFFMLFFTSLVCAVPEVDIFKSPVIVPYWTMLVIEGHPLMAYVAAVLFSFQICKIRRIKVLVSGPVASSKLFLEWFAVLSRTFIEQSMDEERMVASHCCCTLLAH